MVFTVDFLDDGAVRTWTLTETSANERRVDGYTPTVFVDAGGRAASETLHHALCDDPKVVATEHEQWYTNLADTTRSAVLRVDLEQIDDVEPFAREVRHHHEPDDATTGTYRLYNVDLTPQFRYCLEAGVSPVPNRPLRTLELELDQRRLSNGHIDGITVDGEALTGSTRAILETLAASLDDIDPDVLIVNTAELVPLVIEQAREHDLASFHFGRLPGLSQLAGGSTYESYGQVGYAAPRYHVPGRVLLDTSNSFLWHQSSLAGILDLVERSYRPLEETAWASIGTVLTAIQIRRAFERDVLVPWNKWEPEAFKDVRTLHTADRGGFTFAPRVGLHEDVTEVDFASLYPRIICEYNISPDTIRCDCHSERADVPELGYSVCDERGFLVDVLEPLLADRAEIKAQLAAVEDESTAAALRSRSGALKWILVSCFGYQGYRNAKFGRIECHEAINAHARDILLQAKEVFEDGGWRVVHGIVDSLWVRRDRDDACELADLTQAITDEVGITLDHEHDYEWICFVPRRGRRAGALTKYFGKRSTGGYTLRGIEARQRSTPTFVESAQREYIELLDHHRDPERICDRLARHIASLHRREVPPESLVICNRVTKSPGEYTHQTLAAAALERSHSLGVTRQPGQDVRYLVLDADPGRADRVALHFESLSTNYDVSFYRDRLVRACESIISPLGWDRERIEARLRDDRPVTLAAYGSSDE